MLRDSWRRFTQSLNTNVRSRQSVDRSNRLGKSTAVDVCILERRTLLSSAPIVVAPGVLDESHVKGEDHDSHSEADVLFGLYTPEEFAILESYVPDSSLSSKTPPVAAPDGSHEANILTFVLDFKESSQANTTDIFGNVVSTFDITSFGFTASQFNTVAQSILAEVDQDYFSELIGTVGHPVGQDLRVDFIIGNIGTAPAGLTNYYFVQIGTGESGPHSGGTLGVAGGSVVRNSTGTGPNGVVVGDVVASVFTDAIQSLSGLSPSNALSSGNLTFTTFAVAGTLSHEIGHTLSLSHINKAGSVQPTSVPPLMGTGAIDLLNQDRIGERSFSISGVDGENGNATRAHIQQLVNAVGLHTIPNTASSIAGRVFDDKNGNGGQGSGENGLSGRTVYLDLDNDGIFDQGTGAPVTFNSSSATPIIDLSTVTNQISVSGISNPIADVNVKINITHTFDADLDVFLISPTGTRVELFTDVGDENNNFTNTILDDEATTSITAGVAPFTGTFRPEGSLSLLDGGLANGVWTLEITDDFFDDIGNLASWSLTITSGQAEPSVTTNGTGDYLFNNLAPDTYHVRQVLPTGWQQTFPTSNAAHNVVLASNATVTGKNFGAREIPGSVSGTIWNDLDNDRFRDPGENGLANFIAYIDADNDRVFDTGELNDATDANGFYQINAVPAGNTVVRAVGLNGWEQTFPAPSTSQFQIEVVFPDSTLNAAQQAIFLDAAARWSEIIIGDIPDIAGIDDLRIEATAPAIDGVGGILGQAGPTVVRSGSFLPVEGIMEFDSADVANLVAAG
ncbi:MAG: hypothetical protein FJ267_03645, partial [Planctomycetes bacterium]|nr:hypothetical protein [Planctomycetota bacterium]